MMKEVKISYCSLITSYVSYVPYILTADMLSTACMVKAFENDPSTLHPKY